MFFGQWHERGHYATLDESDKPFAGRAPHGPPRVPGQAALRPPRRPGAERSARDRRGGGGPGRRGARLPVRRQGPGADRRPRQGRRHQGRPELGGGRGARQGDPRAWTSAATPSTSCGSRRPRTSRPSTTRRSSSTARRKAPLVMLSTQGGMDIEEVAEEQPGRDRPPARRPAARLPGLPRPAPRFEAGVDADVVRPVGALLLKLYDAFIAEEAMLVEVNPLIVTGDRARDGARRQGHARRQRAVPPPRQRGAARPVGRGPAGADGQGARASPTSSSTATSASSATAPGS